MSNDARQPPIDTRVAAADARVPLDATAMQRALRRVASEIVERDRGADLVLVGIRTAGVPLADRLAKLLEGELTAARGAIDITLYRDDVATSLPKPVVGETKIPGHTLEGKRVILVDDVLYTGRTIRAALDAIMDYGRPRTVELAVLVDRVGPGGRSLRELPIQPDYVGVRVETVREEEVRVHLTELPGEHGGPDRVEIVSRAVGA